MKDDDVAWKRVRCEGEVDAFSLALWREIQKKVMVPSNLVAFGNKSLFKIFSRCAFFSRCSLSDPISRATNLQWIYR